MKITFKKPDGSTVEGNTVPFSTEDERFSTYSPNVPPDHPLSRKIIKFKAVVHTITFMGVNPETGIPEVQIQFAPVCGIE